ncbi:methionine synthase reductase [Patella vulgata]|uniref:methionine synthase reductase n=1 Tax=Patella vulgata TaxID=6465 RepID=UPI00218054D4|nr:methionine synthase reductase [Patella vulgata]
MPINTKNRFLLLYGSQTGQAKAIAEEIADKAENHGLHADIHCMSQTEKTFNLEKENCAVFVVSTTGEGDAPDTASKFLRRLRKKTLPEDYLCQLSYTVLGLGDTNYTNFCNCGKTLNKRILELGAKLFYNPGWADDGVGLEIVVEPWLDNLFESLKKQLHISSVPTDATMDNTASNMNSNQREILDPLEKKTDLNTVVNLQMTDNDSHLDNKASNADKTITDQGSDLGQDSSRNNSSSDIGNENDSKTIPCLTSTVPPLSDSDLTLPAMPPSYIHVTFDENLTIDLTDLPRQNGYPFPSANSDVKMVAISSATILTSNDSVKKTLKIGLDIKNRGITYEPGDAVSIICPNNEHEVNDLLKRLNVLEKADTTVDLSIISDTKKRRAVIPPHIPEQATLRHIFLTCIDIREPPKKALLRVFVEHTSHPREKRRLQELCSKQGSNDYSQFIREQSLSIMDILTAFPSCHPPLHSILEHTSRLKPRPYSACSALSACPDRLEFVFNVLEIPEGNGRCTARQGVCTGWLDNITKSIQTNNEDLNSQMSSLSLNEDIQIPIFTRTNQHFRPPTDLSCPVIFIGPGTGVAPFIGFLLERQKRKQSLVEETTYGETWLFYGCRNKNKDYLFKQELEDFHGSGTLNKLCVCFSRDDQPEDSPRYVQDFLLQETDAISKLIETEKLLIYVCGDAKNMAKDVNEALAKIIKTKMGLSEEGAKSYLMKMRLHRRYFEDVWT